MDWFEEEKAKIIESNLKIDMSAERLQEMQEKIQGKTPQDAIKAMGYSQYDINTAIRVAMKDSDLLDMVLLHKMFGSPEEGSGLELPYLGNDDDMKPEIREEYDAFNKKFREMIEEEFKKPRTPWQKFCDWWLTKRIEFDEKRGKVIY